MTGRELILYILTNNLENEPVVKDGKPVGFLTITEAAIKFGVGEATIMTWIALKELTGIRIGNVIYIPDIYDDSDDEVEGE